MGISLIEFSKSLVYNLLVHLGDKFMHFLTNYIYIALSTILDELLGFRVRSAHLIRILLLV